MTAKLADLQVKLFTDGADKAQILEMAQKPWIAGFTTNPSLLRKAGVTDYEAYGRDLTAAVPDRHISFEVFLGRHSGDGRAGAPHHPMGQERLRQIAGDQYPRRAAHRRHSHAVGRWREGERDGDLHRRTSRSHDRRARWQGAGLRVGIRGPTCRSRHRLSADHAAGRGQGARDQECRDHLGLNPRSVQRHRGR